MFRIQNITTDPLQERDLILPDGSILTLTMYYRPMQYGWFINSLVYGDFTLKGVRITNNPNLLFQFKNQIPFGMACYSDENREPYLIEDFSSDSSKLYILTEADIEQYEDFLNG